MAAIIKCVSSHPRVSGWKTSENGNTQATSSSSPVDVSRVSARHCRANPGAGRKGPRTPHCPSDEGGGFALKEGT